MINQTEIMLNMLQRVYANREPDQQIGGTPGDPYMRRWYILRDNETQAGHVYLHHILHSDDDRALHDHPWESCSIILRGSIREILPDGSRVLHAGDIVYRDAQSAHRLELINGQPAWTLFMTGSWERSWGFHCPEGWKPWRLFEAAGGCGERDD